MNNYLAKDLEFILRNVDSMWEKLRNESIFITGGTGFFGCWMLESFLYANTTLHLNAKATLLTRDKKRFLNKYPHLAHNPALTFLEGDISEFTYPPQKFTYIIHAAADTCNLKSLNSLSVWHTIVNGTRHVLEFARHCQAKEILFTSSGAVYGEQPYNLTHIPESYPCQSLLMNQEGTYAAGKCAAEHLCFLYAQNYGLEIKIARCFAFIGPYLSLTSSYAVANFIANGLKKEAIVIQGDGTPYRSYLYAADLAIWLWTILFKGQSMHPYNVGSDKIVSIKELADLVASAFEYNPQVILKKNSNNAFAQRYVPNIQRAQNELGLVPKIDLSTAIQSTIAWHSSLELSYAD